MNMIKKRNISVYDDLKTGFFYKFCLLLGIVLLAVYIFLKIVSLTSSEGNAGPLQAFYDLSQSGIPEPVLAFSIILLGVGFILYFFNCMFAKLAKIADEIENEEDFEEE